MERGLVIGLVSLMLFYPVLFVFGMNKYTFALLMYIVVASSVLASSSGIKPGNYKVETDNSVFEDYFVSDAGPFLVFKKHVVRKSDVKSMERVEKQKDEKKTLYEYFH